MHTTTLGNEPTSPILGIKILSHIMAGTTVAIRTTRAVVGGDPGVADVSDVMNLVIHLVLLSLCTQGHPK